MSRFLAESVTADLFGRSFDLLLFLLLFPFVLLVARLTPGDLFPCDRQVPLRARQGPEAA